MHLKEREDSTAGSGRQGRVFPRGGQLARGLHQQPREKTKGGVTVLLINLNSELGRPRTSCLANKKWLRL